MYKLQNSIIVAQNDFKVRAKNYGVFVKTYRDPELTLMMLENLNLSSNLRVLDVACGQGDGSRHLRAIGAETFYLDATLEMMVMGIQRGNIEKSLCSVADISLGNLPFKDKIFDIVTCRYAFHDVNNQHVVLNELSRIIKCRGQMQIIDMSHPDPTAVKFYNKLHGWKTLKKYPRETHILSEQEYVNLFKDENFEVVNKSWYISKVNTAQWLKEGQIDYNRHEFLKRLIKREIKKNPTLAQQFKISCQEDSLTICFPVLLICCRKIS